MRLDPSHQTIAIAFTPPDGRLIKGGDWKWLGMRRCEQPISFAKHDGGLQLNMPVDLAPSLLKDVLVTQQMGLVFSVDGQESKFFLPAAEGISVEGTCKAGTSSYELKVVSSKDKASIAMLVPAGWPSAQVFVDGRRQQIRRLVTADLGSYRFAVVKIAPGTHKVQADRDPRASWADVPEVKG